MTRGGMKHAGMKHAGMKRRVKAGGEPGTGPEARPGAKAAPGLACGSCTACCQNEQIRLAPEDDPGRYDVEVRADGVWIAARADGRPGCRYLGPKGCTIYAKRPAACRAFDCRLYFLGKSPAEIEARLRASPGTARTFAAAIARLHTLPRPGADA
jgi:Fe-S-cluster containining protein